MSTSQPTVDWSPSRSVSGERTESAKTANLLTLYRELKVRDFALDRIRHGLSVFDGQHRLQLFNRRYAEMYGLDPKQLRLGMTLRDVLALRYAAGTGSSAMSPDEFELWLRRVSAANRRIDTEMTLHNGRVHIIHHEPTMGGGWVATFEDVTERREAEAHIRHMALHDDLTGLPNRARFTVLVERALARLRGESRLDDHRPALTEGNWLAAVLIFDLDHFKDVNDTLGHVSGDALLRLVAERIGRCLRPEDMLARMGGDEFAVLLEEVGTAQQVADVARRMIDAAAVPYELDGHEVVIGISVGITLCSREGEIVEAPVLLSQADIALYQAKTRNRGTSCFFQPMMHATLHRRKQMERDLRHALVEGGLEVHFQPITDVSSRRIVGAEALARWSHPVHGMVPPSEFIPLAERAGLIGRLGAWVLRTACAQAAQWDGLGLAVNLSPEQVRRPGIVELVASVLRETGLPPCRLELEITEGSLLHETPQTLLTLTRLRALGVSIALDDFGTGFSSLSYLRRYPFTKLKVDRSFVGSMAADTVTAAIVQAVVTLGRSLSMRVIAEGVETEAQFTMLSRMDCDEAQGYLLGRPCRGADFSRLIALQGGTGNVASGCSADAAPVA